VRSAPLFVVCKEEATVAALLSRLGKGAAEALEEGRIFIGKRRATAGDIVRAGEEVWLYPGRPSPREPPRILLEQHGVVAVYKPPDMATVADHRGSAASLESVVKTMLGRHEPLVVTSRLDVGVSGVVLFATDESSRRALARAREEGRYQRHYVAVSVASPDPKRGSWTAPIGRAGDPRLRRVGGPSAVPAETAYAVVATSGQGALLAVEPKTGRTHQIRVHAAHAGCPLWGDGSYGGPTRLISGNGAVAAVERIALHAAWVEVPLGESAILRAEAPFPSDFAAIWSGCGGDLSAFAAALSPIYPVTR
jgi:23S rRNA-/tRNA-specific pseudouridylate synthase